MSTAELRVQLFSLLDALPARQLRDAYDLLKERFGAALPDEAEVLTELPEAHRQGIQEAIEEMERGEWSTHEEVMQRMRKKLAQHHDNQRK